MRSVAAALLLVSTPALADWPPTHWGMTVDDVLAIYPGAETVTAGKQDTIRKRQRLAWGPFSDGGMALRADFYFDPATRQLAMVRIEPKDLRQCRAWHDLLVSRHGPGKEKVTRLDGSNKANQIALTEISWSRPAPDDRLDYGSAAVNDVFIACGLLVAPPG